MRHITFTVLGPPVGKQIVVRAKPFPGAFPTPKAKAYIEQVSAIARIAKERDEWETPATDVAAALSINVAVPMPKSWTKKKKAALQMCACTGKPDLDNIVKAVVDGLVGPKIGHRSYEGILLAEDDQLWSISAQKRWIQPGHGRVDVTLTVFD